MSTNATFPFTFSYYDYPRRHQRLNSWGTRNPEQEFGVGITPEDVLTFVSTPWYSEDYYRPWKKVADSTSDVGSTIKADKDKFQVNLDVHHFSPEELCVKTTDKYIVVEGCHEEKEDDHGYISRQFVRRYPLPEGSTPDLVESRLSSDGVLTIIAPNAVPAAGKDERVVPIVQTGPVRKEVKDNGDSTAAKKK